MASIEKQKRRFRTKQYLLVLYLSIGITGICMLVFSAWTPSNARADSVSNDNLLQSEHNPSNAVTTEPDDGDISDASGESSVTSTSTPTPTPSPTPTPTPSPTPTPTPNPTPNPLQENAYPEVNQLVKNYYNAKLAGEAETFDTLVSDPSAIDVDYLHLQYDLITEFSNFTCYTKNGIAEVAYIVYVSYDSKIVTIDTPVPSLDRLTLVYADDGRLLVNTASELSDEVNAYCDEIFTHDDVRQMYSRETERFENAIASDPELSQLYNRLDP